MRSLFYVGKTEDRLMIKGAIFDMDGLMFDSERIVYESWQKLMDEGGYSYSLDVFKQTIGLRTDATQKLYTAMYGTAFNYDMYRDKARQMFLDRVSKEGVPVKKGLFELLEYLENSGIKTAVATSTSSKTAVKTLKMANAYSHFNEFVCGDEVTHSKPHPQIFLTAAQKLGVAPCECVAFEDSINGIKSAHAAGTMPVMVPDYLEPTDEIRPMLAFLCSDLMQAAAFIKKVNKVQA